MTVFSALVVLTSVPSETSMYHNITFFLLIFHKGIHLKKLEDNICSFHKK